MLLGRGTGVAQHSGNVTFRTLVQRYRKDYRACPRPAKSILAARIVQSIYDQGGRFVQAAAVAAAAAATPTTTTDSSCSQSKNGDIANHPLGCDDDDDDDDDHDHHEDEQHDRNNQQEMDQQNKQNKQNNNNNNQPISERHPRGRPMIGLFAVHEVSRERAIEKTCQALREKLPIEISSSWTSRLSRNKKKQTKPSHRGSKTKSTDEESSQDVSTSAGTSSSTMTTPHVPPSPPPSSQSKTTTRKALTSCSNNNSKGSIKAIKKHNIGSRIPSWVPTPPTRRLPHRLAKTIAFHNLNHTTSTTSTSTTSTSTIDSTSISSASTEKETSLQDTTDPILEEDQPIICLKSKKKRVQPKQDNDHPTISLDELEITDPSVMPCRSSKNQDQATSSSSSSNPNHQQQEQQQEQKEEEEEEQQPSLLPVPIKGHVPNKVNQQLLPEFLEPKPFHAIPRIASKTPRCMGKSGSITSKLHSSSMAVMSPIKTSKTMIAKHKKRETTRRNDHLMGPSPTTPSDIVMKPSSPTLPSLYDSSIQPSPIVMRRQHRSPSSMTPKRVSLDSSGNNNSGYGGDSWSSTSGSSSIRSMPDPVSLTIHPINKDMIRPSSTDDTLCNKNVDDTSVLPDDHHQNHPMVEDLDQNYHSLVQRVMSPPPPHKYKKKKNQNNQNKNLFNTTGRNDKEDQVVDGDEEEEEEDDEDDISCMDESCMCGQKSCCGSDRALAVGNRPDGLATSPFMIKAGSLALLGNPFRPVARRVSDISVHPSPLLGSNQVPIWNRPPSSPWLQSQQRNIPPIAPAISNSPPSTTSSFMTARDEIFDYCVRNGYF